MSISLSAIPKLVSFCIATAVRYDSTRLVSVTVVVEVAMTELAEPATVVVEVTETVVVVPLE